MYRATNKNVVMRFLDRLEKHEAAGEKVIVQIARSGGKATMVGEYRNRGMSASVKNPENVQK